jgi:hypothetical protein
MKLQYRQRPIHRTCKTLMLRKISIRWMNRYSRAPQLLVSLPHNIPVPHIMILHLIPFPPRVILCLCREYKLPLSYHPNFHYLQILLPKRWMGRIYYHTLSSDSDSDLIRNRALRNLKDTKETALALMLWKKKLTRPISYFTLIFAGTFTNAVLHCTRSGSAAYNSLDLYLPTSLSTSADTFRSCYWPLQRNAIPFPLSLFST